MYNEPFDTDDSCDGEKKEPQVYSPPPVQNTNYGWYSYDQRYRPIPPPMSPKPTKRRTGLLPGLIIGLVLGLFCTLIVIAPNVTNKNTWQDDTQTLPFPTFQPTPTTQPESTMPPDEMGGGNAILNIVPVVPTDRLPLTNTKIVAKGQPSTVCILVEDRNTGLTGSGSGIIMTDDGYIITNNHVISGATNVEVVLHDKTRYVAKLVGTDQQSDLAVIKITAVGLTPAEFGDSDALEVGDPVVVIGNPLGLELQGTATSGMISAINRDIEINKRVMTTLQTDASVNQGNSGGPMFNQYGQVVGIISSKVMGSFIGSVEGLGFAIPITSAKPVIDDLIKLGYVAGRPFIGITDYETITAPQARLYSVPQGVQVKAINEKSDAYKQGLRVGDLIVEVNGQEITDGDELNAIKNQYEVGDKLKLKVYRSNEYLEITFELMDSGALR